MEIWRERVLSEGNSKLGSLKSKAIRMRGERSRKQVQGCQWRDMSRKITWSELLFKRLVLPDIL